MRMFLDSLKTPAKIRGLVSDERRNAEVDVAEVALDIIQADETSCLWTSWFPDF